MENRQIGKTQEERCTHEEQNLCFVEERPYFANHHPSPPFFPIIHTVSSLQEHINTNKHTRVPHVKAYTDALLERRRRRDSLCMDDPVGFVPVLEEPGAKV